MRDFKILLQRLIDSETKSNSILGFCRDVYEFKKAYFEYHNAPSKSARMMRYSNYTWYENCIKDWLKTFHLQDKYIPQDFIDE